MEHASGEKDDVESTGRKIWGPTRWASVLNLLGAIQGLYGDEEYADLTITYGSSTFKVHKAVVCTRSDFFRAACRKDTFKEGRENVISIVDDEGPENGKTVCVMIDFMYNLDYEVDTILRHDSSTEAAANDETACTHARVFAVAAKYGIRSLQRSACDKFVQYLSAHQPSAHDLAETIRIVYNFVAGSSGENHQLLNHLQEAICTSDRSILEDPELRGAVERIDGLPFDLFRAQTAKMNVFD